MNKSPEVPTPVLRVADKARKMLWRATNKRTFGSGVAIHDPGLESLVLIQHTYGDRGLWQLPGGGLSRADQHNERSEGETGVVKDVNRYELAAKRELEEELGISADEALAFGYLATSYNESGPSRDLYVVYEAVVEEPAEYLRSAKLSSEIGSLACFSLEQASSLPTHHAVQKALDNLIQRQQTL